MPLKGVNQSPDSTFRSSASTIIFNASNGSFLLLRLVTPALRKRSVVLLKTQYFLVSIRSRLWGTGHQTMTVPCFDDLRFRPNSQLYVALVCHKSIGTINRKVGLMSDEDT